MLPKAVFHALKGHFIHKKTKQRPKTHSRCFLLSNFIEPTNTAQALPIRKPSKKLFCFFLFRMIHDLIRCALLADHAVLHEYDFR